jgi:hypothetical protein
MENPKIQENFEKCMKAFDKLDASIKRPMRVFDKLDASMERTMRAIYFLCGGAVALLIMSIIEVIKNV